MQNFADDISPYATDMLIEEVIGKLEDESRILLEWLDINYFKANPDKSHLLLTKDDVSLKVDVGVDIQSLTNNK